jgi:uncharacterized lipoprotein YajG
MKTLFVAVAIALLAGCAGMQDGGRSSSGFRGSSGASDMQNKSDDIFHSWLN